MGAAKSGREVTVVDNVKQPKFCFVGEPTGTAPYWRQDHARQFGRPRLGCSAARRLAIDGTGTQILGEGAANRIDLPHCRFAVPILSVKAQHSAGDFQ
jgi:hypothetical protein